MKQKLIFGMLGSLLLASCANDEMVQMNQNEIRFNAVTASTSRAYESYDSNNSPMQFKVWAWTSNAQHALYIPGEIASRAGGSSVWNLAKNRYWPEDTGLDFVAYSGDPDNTFTFDGTTRRFVNYAVKNQYFDQLDLIYSVEPGKTASVSATNLNFKHALSQLRFKATLANPTLKVSFEKISVCNVAGQGTYTLPDNSEEIGTWADYGELKSFSVDAHSIGETCIIDATTPEKMISGHNIATMMALLPQQQDAWVPTAGNTASGAYLAVDCSIYSVESGTDVKLNQGNTIYIPLTVDWEQGKRYTYNIVFGMGHAGYVNPESPVETLAGVDLTVTADDYCITASTEFNDFRIQFDATPATEGLEDYVITTPNDYVHFTIPKAPNVPEFFAKTPQDFNEEIFAGNDEPLVKFNYWDVQGIAYSSVIKEEGQIDNLQPGDIVTLKKSTTNIKNIPVISLTPIWDITIYVTAHYGLDLHADATDKFERKGVVGVKDFATSVGSSQSNFWTRDGYRIFHPVKNDAGEIITPSDDLKFLGWSLTEKPDPANNNYTAKDCFLIYDTQDKPVTFAYGNTDHGRLHIYAVYGHK